MSRLCLLCVHSNDLSPVKPLIIIITNNKRNIMARMAPMIPR